MKETRLYIKYDGKLKAYEDHQIDAKVLAKSLENLADLIYDSNSLLNGSDQYVRVNAQAGFFKGSFGLELIVSSAVEILPYLGLVAAPVVGGLINVVLDSKGEKPDEIEVDEKTGKTKLTFNDGENVKTIETPSEVYKLFEAAHIRKRLNHIIREPLSSEGTDSFQILGTPDDEEPLYEVVEDQKEYFKPIKIKKPDSEDVLESVAKVEFVKTNKDSGLKGWTIRHLGNEVPVRIHDKTFIDDIKKADAPSLHGLKYVVEMEVKTITREHQEPTRTYKITKVRSAVKEAFSANIKKQIKTRAEAAKKKAKAKSSADKKKAKARPAVAKKRNPGRRA